MDTPTKARTAVVAFRDPSTDEIFYGYVTRTSISVARYTKQLEDMMGEELWKDAVVLLLDNSLRETRKQFRKSMNLEIESLYYYLYGSIDIGKSPKSLKDLK